jgi:hypothetical protein
VKYDPASHADSGWFWGEYTYYTVEAMCGAVLVWVHPAWKEKGMVRIDGGFGWTEVGVDALPVLTLASSDEAMDLLRELRYRARYMMDIVDFDKTKEGYVTPRADGTVVVRQLWPLLELPAKSDCCPDCDSNNFLCLICLGFVLSGNLGNHVCRAATGK